MKTLFIYRLVMITLLSASMFSCLEKGLDDLPAFEDAEISSVNFEYRWLDNSNDFARLEVVKMNTVVDIPEGSTVVNCDIAVPDESESFPASIRNNITLSNLVAYMDISVAAIIEPVGNAPVLGTPGDFSQSSFEYEVIAADGKTTNVWTININSFVK
ncbi:MAG: hypothetical protein JXR03_16565 [Cyclobacteriaceae bacterium]